MTCHNSNETWNCCCQNIRSGPVLFDERIRTSFADKELQLFRWWCIQNCQRYADTLYGDSCDIELRNVSSRPSQNETPPSYKSGAKMSNLNNSTCSHWNSHCFSRSVEGDIDDTMILLYCYSLTSSQMVCNGKVDGARAWWWWVELHNHE